MQISTSLGKLAHREAHHCLAGELPTTGRKKGGSVGHKNTSQGTSTWRHPRCFEGQTCGKWHWTSKGLPSEAKGLLNISEPGLKVCHFRQKMHERPKRMKSPSPIMRNSPTRLLICCHAASSTSFRRFQVDPVRVCSASVSIPYAPSCWSCERRTCHLWEAPGEAPGTSKSS